MAKEPKKTTIVGIDVPKNPLQRIITNALASGFKNYTDLEHATKIHARTLETWHKGEHNPLREVGKLSQLGLNAISLSEGSLSHVISDARTKYSAYAEVSALTGINDRTLRAWHAGKNDPLREVRKLVQLGLAEIPLELEQPLKAPQEKTWFVRALEAEMLALGMNQEQFATQILKLSSKTLSFWLNQEREPNLRSVIYIAEKLGWKLELGVPCLNPEQSHTTPTHAVTVLIPLMKADDNPLPEMIRAELDTRGISQAELSRVAKIPVMTISDWRKGNCNPLSSMAELGASLGWRSFKILVPALVSNEELAQMVGVTVNPDAARMVGVTVNPDAARMKELETRLAETEAQLATTQAALAVLTQHVTDLAERAATSPAALLQAKGIDPRVLDSTRKIR